MKQGHHKGVQKNVIQWGQTRSP